MQGPVIDHGQIRHVRECAIEYLVDNAVVAIGLVYRRDDEHDFEIMTAPDRIDRPHLTGDLVFVTGIERPVGISERIFILDERLVRIGGIV